jgi:DNA repair exonuclease SbcCD ATPase subunit
VQETISAIDSRREYFDGIQRQLAEVGSLSSRLEERSRQIAARMESAEQQFNSLTSHAEEAERMTRVIADVSTGLREAAQETDTIVKQVTAIESRCGSIEGIADKTRALGQEIEQRQRSLDQAAKDLRQVSELRQQATASAQQLDEQMQRINESLSGANQQAAQIGTLSGALEDRSNALLSFDRRLTEFEERMAKWGVADQEIARSLEQIVARQSTVESLRGDLDRMFAMAEKTANDVRAITSAQREIADTRVLLEEHQVKLRDIRETATSLTERQRQMTKAEERLARAEALLVDVRGSLETLQAQKALVDQAVEKAGSLRFLTKQAEAMIEGLREERKMTADLKTALIATADEDDEEVASAA